MSKLTQRIVNSTKLVNITDIDFNLISTSKLIYNDDNFKITAMLENYKRGDIVRPERYYILKVESKTNVKFFKCFVLDLKKSHMCIVNRVVISNTIKNHLNYNFSTHYPQFVKSVTPTK